jgi:hypothetical protein
MVYSKVREVRGRFLDFPSMQLGMQGLGIWLNCLDAILFGCVCLKYTVSILLVLLIRHNFQLDCMFCLARRSY